MIAHEIDAIIEVARDKGLQPDEIDAIVSMMETSEERLVALLNDFGVEFGDERVD
jgi:hypothetical protein